MDREESKAGKGKNAQLWSWLQLLAIGLSVLLLYSPSNTLGDPGIGWHLKAGGEIWRTGAAPWHDPFGVSQNPWIHDQWLSDVVFYLHATFGRGAFRALFVALVLTAWVWLPLPETVRASGSHPYAPFIATVLTFGMGSLQWFERPVLFSFALFALCCALCRKVLRDPARYERWLLCLPAVFLVWSNLHPAFFLGLVAISCLLFERVFFDRSRVSVAAIALSALATFINPYGWQLHGSALRLVTNRYFLDLNWEWAAPSAQERVFAPFFFAVAMLLLAAGRGALRKVRLGEMLLVGALLSMSLLQRRYIPFFSLAVAPLLALSLVQVLPTRKGRQLDVGFPWSIPIVGCLLAFGSLSDRARVELSDHFPKQEVAMLLEQERGKVFHSPDLGGYLVWVGWPPSIDDRNQLLGVEPYERFFQIYKVESGWKRALVDGGYQYLLLEPKAPVVAAIATDPEWVELVRGSRAVLFKRR